MQILVISPAAIGQSADLDGILMFSSPEETLNVMARALSVPLAVYGHLSLIVTGCDHMRNFVYFWGCSYNPNQINYNRNGQSYNPNI